MAGLLSLVELLEYSTICPRQSNVSGSYSVTSLYLNTLAYTDRLKLEEALETELDDEDDTEDKLLNMKEDDGKH
jgi:hypothetical protein